jgi:hypothetical protein
VGAKCEGQDEAAVDCVAVAETAQCG